jgi:DNA recombination protein Rad52
MKAIAELERELAQPLDPDRIEDRPGTNGKRFDYLEGWEVIAKANEVFGTLGWSSETLTVDMLHDPALIRDPDDPNSGKVVAAYAARVRITIHLDGRNVVREGWGGARNFAKTAGEAMENAIKSAETDATKRALRTLGNAFGLALYDPERKGVGKPVPAPQLPDGTAVAPIDQGFGGAGRPSISQRALGVAKSNGRARADVTGIPV